MGKELKKTRKALSHQTENINKKYRNYFFKKGTKQILEPKSTLTDMKHSLEWFNSRFEKAEKKDERIED